MTIKIIEHEAYLTQVTPYIYIEEAARNCYKSKMSEASKETEKFIKRLINKGHEAMLEFCDLTFRLITDRGVMAELTRHRVGCSYAIESTRYCNYGNKTIQFIKPINLEVEINTITTPYTAYEAWFNSVEFAAECYQNMLKYGCSPQIARSVLPMSLATSIYAKFNMRSFRHFLKLRLDKAAHPDMRYVAQLMAKQVMNTELAFMIEDITKDFISEIN